MISFVPLTVVGFSAAKYMTYEGSRALKLMLVSSKNVNAEVVNTLSIHLKDGSATCKLNIL